MKLSSLDFNEYPDRDLMMIDLANRMAGELRRALQARGRATLAVAGGSTPGQVFDALCAADLDWASVTVLPTDDRLVPEDSPRSNARMIREHLLKDRAAEAAYLSLTIEPGASPDPVAAAVAPVLPLDVALVGMGADMHMASIFPEAPELAAALAADAPAVLSVTPPGGLEPRLTLSAQVLKDAMATHLLITGPEKRAALEKAVAASDARVAPVRAILQHAAIHWAE